MKLLRLSFVGLSALVVGAGAGVMVLADARLGIFWHRSVLGPLPSWIGEGEHVGAVLLSLVALLGAWICARAQSAGFERLLIGVFVFSLFADVIPAMHQVSYLLLLAYAAGRFLRRRSASRISATPLLIPLFFIVAVYAATLPLASRPGPAFLDFGFRLLGMSMVVLLPVVLLNRKRLDWVIQAMIASAAIAASVGILQLLLSFATGDVITFGDPEFNRIITPFGVYPRCTGLMLHPNHQSNVLGTVALLVMHRATSPHFSAQERWRLGGIFGLLLLGVLVTGSRSGFLALGIGAAVIPVLRWPGSAWIYLTVCSLIAFVFWKSGAAEALIEAVKALNASSADFRWRVDHLAAAAFQTSPWLGVGVGGILDWYNPWHLEVHDTYLQILAETGILGAVAFVILGGMVAFRLLARFMTSRVMADRERYAALLLASIMILVQNSVAMFLWVKFLWFWIALVETAILLGSSAPTAASDQDC